MVSTELESKEKKLTLDSEIKSFVNTLPDWAKYLAKKLLSGTGLKDSEHEIAFNYFKEDNGLEEKEERPEIIIEISDKEKLNFKTDLILNGIKNLKGVNALTEKQSIELSTNITVVYGANGSGKTGYIRLFNNVFFSRSKDKDIIPNIKLGDECKAPACEFIFQSEGNIYSLKYPKDKEKAEFKQFAVFDRKSVLIHLNDKKDFVFRPKALDFFTELVTAYENVKEKLNTEINSKNISKDFSVLFDGDSSIKKLIVDLSDKTQIHELKKHTPFSSQDRENRKKLEDQKIELEANKKSKDQQIKYFKNIKELLNNLKADIEAINTFFNMTKCKEIQTTTFICNERQKIARKEGIEKFKTDNLKAIGSSEWKAFIKASEAFAKKQQKEKYPEKGDYCLFCQQPLKEKEVELIESYWEFIKSKAEEDARKIKENLDSIKIQYEKINFDLLPDNNILSEWLKENYTDIFISLLKYLKAQKELCQKIISDIEKQQYTEKMQFKIESPEFTEIETFLKKKIISFEDESVNKKLEKINTSITYLCHKEKLFTHIDDIERYVILLKWITKAESKRNEFNPISITNKGKQLSNKYFGQKYKDKFYEECDALNAHFDIELFYSGSHGSSYREFKIKNRFPSQILSEGEQRAISLADFLAEIELSRINKGIIFDDPVNSLDEERKSNIAERLVKESLKRQVLIFTHDLVFISSIIGYCEDMGVAFDCHWIEKLNDQPGTIHLRNTPCYEKGYKNSEKAKQLYNKARKCKPEERETNIKNGFGALRTSYEALVIFNLFEGVVQRFNERVSIDSLSKVYFDKAIRDEIINNFNQCCRYMEGHLHSDKYGYKKPKVDNLKEEIERFDELKKKLKELKKRLKE
jgi:energy-coupling factor transporter ATP-binding protein EcfA2